MRISSAYQYDRFQLDVRAAQERMFEASQQVTTGRRIGKPSDDPFGTSQTISMRSLKSGMEQYRANLNTAKATLSFTESTASDIHDLMQQAYVLAVGGASGSTDQAGRNAMAEEVTQIQSKLLEIANSKGPGGSYLFAGQQTATKPYTIVGSTLTYNGDANSISSEVGPGEVMVTSTAGEPMISDAYNRLESLKNDLIGGQVGAISGVDIANVQASLTTILQVRSSIGAKLQTIADLDSQWQRRSDELTNSISDVEDVDISEAIVKYQQAGQAYQAALTVASQGFRLSLMDFIKG